MDKTDFYALINYGSSGLLIYLIAITINAIMLNPIQPESVVCNKLSIHANIAVDVLFMSNE